MYRVFTVALLILPALIKDVQSARISSFREERSSRYLEMLNADARIYVYHNFLSEEECDHIITKAADSLKPSDVRDEDTGDVILTSARTSDGVFLERGGDPVIEGIERRIAQWTLFPVYNQEGLQVLRYLPTNRSDAHYDCFFTEENIRNGGNRLATVLIYLNDVEEGGETIFPKIPAPNGVNKGYSDCAKHVLAVKPRRGDALLFYSLNYKGEVVQESLHAACPVIKGVKWSMPTWIHWGHYDLHGDKYDSERAYMIAEQMKQQSLAGESTSEK